MHLHFRSSAALIGCMIVVAAIVGHSDDQTTTTISNNDWGRMGSFAGVNPNVCALTSWKDTLYAGGTLRFAGTDSVCNIARWDGAKWGSMGDGLNGQVHSLVVDSTGAVYAGGAFDSAGGVRTRYIATWAHKRWSPLGEGANNSVNALAFDNRRGTLYAGGFFDSIGNIRATSIAQWDGTSWKAFDTVPFEGVVTALTLDTSGNLYVGTGNKIFVWNRKEWTESGTEEFCLGKSFRWSLNRIDGMVYDESRKLLYAVGSYRIDSTDINGSRDFYDGFLFKWDGSDWSTVGSCSSTLTNRPLTTYTVSGIACDNKGNIYLGGHFTLENDCIVGNFDGDESLLKWDGTSWNETARFLDSDGSINALHSDGSGNLYIGGWFLNLDTVTAKSVIKYSNGSFKMLGYSGVGLPVSELAFDNNGTLWAQRVTFKYGNQIRKKETLRKDDRAWNLSPVAPLLLNGKIIEHDDTIGSGINKLLPQTKAVVSDGHGTLCAAGAYDSSTVLKKWDGSLWTNITGMLKSSAINALAFDNNRNLYIAGNNLEIWNGTQFSSVPPPKLPSLPPISGAQVTRLCYDSVNGIMYGDYRGTTWINNQTTPYTQLFKWGTDSVEVISPLITGEVKGMVCGPDGSLFIGGVFDTIGSLRCNNLAKWDGTSWSALGSGTDKQWISINDWYRSVMALAINDTLLYVGGSFLNAAGRCSPYLANVNIRGTGNTPIAGKPRQSPTFSPAISLRRQGTSLYFVNLLKDDRILLYSLSGRLLSNQKGVSVLPLNKLSCQVLFVTVLRGNRSVLSATISVY